MRMKSFIVISAVRNEAAFIEETIKSMLSQTLRPTRWLIVNDGSSDETAAIVERYLSGYPFIQLIHKQDRGFTNVGKGVIEAFNFGLKNIDVDWEYIVKMDCDLIFCENFFEEYVKEFEANNKLGIIGPTCFVKEGNRLIEEKTPKYHPIAAARMYRKECFFEIGGLVETLGWDTLDLIRAQMNGWKTKRIPALKVVHRRRMSSRAGLWEGKVRTGKNFYITGYHPLFLIARSLYRLFQKPYFIESFGVIWGYVKASFLKNPEVVSREEKAFFQKQQLRRLFFIKNE